VSSAAPGVFQAAAWGCTVHLSFSDTFPFSTRQGIPISRTVRLSVRATATVLEVLGVQRPASQAEWAFDGVSLLPIFRGEEPELRGIGWMYMTPTASVRDGYAFRYGNWKLAVGGISCDPESATFNCSAPQLYDMSNDIEENHDLALKEPAVLAAIMKNFSNWHESILFSMANESMCKGGGGHHGGGGGGGHQFPKQRYCHRHHSHQRRVLRRLPRDQGLRRSGLQ
jgi:hypothetical protein